MADATVLWEACAAAIQSQVSDVVWQMTFTAAQPVTADDETLVVSVPSTLIRDRIEGRYHTVVHDAVAEVSDDQLTLRIVIREEDPEEDLALLDPIPPTVEPPTSSEPSVPLALDPLTRPTATSTDIPFAGRLTFEDFVIGTSNRFAHAAAQAVAETPGRSYNPLFIYGDAGLGKTHLLQAVGNYVTAHYPTYQVRYVSSETFMNRFVEAIRNKQLPEFKERYRRNDVLLVDDIQFMEGKEGLQEEFFHTFNSIQGEGGQIVLTSDRAPDSISTLEDRLRSRFKMGLVTHIQPPDVETRLAILRKKVVGSSSGVPVPDDVLLFIAENVTDNIRELEGALTRVTAYSSLNNEPCTRDLALSILGDLISTTSPLVITPDLILAKTSEIYGFSREDLVGASRRRPLVTARQVSMYVFREITDLSYPAIAREFGGRDHTTVIHAVDKISRLMAERRDIYDQVSALVSAVRSRN
ncbi:MAG: chromosomal replication initiator protein DnaA [Actinomycetota bacterium]|nr:chromosomal replication initiator protein DnaA [Acidimicrobiales bacterium]MEC8814814.1 chromosomal replication initiator protein DnaA [Actinomycetota bacterium]MEC8983095.1 chromosomal replication initiator protein DnaA [Actinomycetota bacterium]MEC9450679.1 chromosomal replication initiator protein DnaA [Actinomycetota bacterium]